MVMGDLPVETQVLVLGAGPGGYAAAFRAVELGLEVTLVTDDPKPGSVCLLRGCIPSKALLYLAEVRLASREASRMGMTFGEPDIDLAQVRSWKDGVVEKLTDGLETLCEQRGVQLVRGRGRFQGPRRLGLTESEYSSVRFEHAIIATGTRPTAPPGLAGVRAGVFPRSKEERSRRPAQRPIPKRGVSNSLPGLVFFGVTVRSLCQKTQPMVKPTLKSFFDCTRGLLAKAVPSRFS
jgi:pyruvate/2-oxoglutarate dehydrogenase complex dihydrolipoamide dehydrogenase (E3) component